MFWNKFSLLLEVSMAKIKFDIWNNKEGLSQLAAAGSLGVEERSIREDDSEIVHSFWAETRMEAMQKYYDFLDYGIYESHNEEDDKFNKIPFDIDEMKARVKWWNEQQSRKK
jgi:hypothetical protein